jgi:hypothetical protein
MQSKILSEVSAKGAEFAPALKADETEAKGTTMTRLALALLLLALAGCVEAMPAHDEDNRLMNKTWPGENAPGDWRPRMLFEGSAA